FVLLFFFFHPPPTSLLYTLSLHDALPISYLLRHPIRCIAQQKRRLPRRCVHVPRRQIEVPRRKIDVLRRKIDILRRHNVGTAPLQTITKIRAMRILFAFTHGNVHEKYKPLSRYFVSSRSRKQRGFKAFPSL